MDGSDACAGVQAQLGVYLTGSIAQADRAAVVRHLASCADCRDELASLASLPALLRRVTVLTDAEGYTLRPALAAGDRARGRGPRGDRDDRRDHPP